MADWQMDYDAAAEHWAEKDKASASASASPSSSPMAASDSSRGCYVDAYDYYLNGVYQHTRYCIMSI